MTTGGALAGSLTSILLIALLLAQSSSAFKFKGG